MSETMTDAQDAMTAKGTADTRLTRRFAGLKAEGRGGLVTFVTAGDPDYDTGMALLKGLPGAGADVIELGMPFTDPMADGPAIQAANLRALAAGMTLTRTLAMVTDFRRGDNETPIVLMGYFNPIHNYGIDRFLEDAKKAGVDGLIVVDMPPEEDDELCIPALRAGFNFIRLATPTTDDKRLPAVLAHTSGFVYYVSITGITGAGSATETDIKAAVDRLSAHTTLPIAVGFGISTPEQAASIVRVADAAVVGSAIIKEIAGNIDETGQAKDDLVEKVLSLVEKLSASVRTARR